MPYGNLRIQVIVGLFMYTGIPYSSFSSNARWYSDFLNNILMDVKIKGFRKLFKRYPSLVPFK